MGLFSPYEMQYSLNRDKDKGGEPSLAEMTEKVRYKVNSLLPAICRPSFFQTFSPQKRLKDKSIKYLYSTWKSFILIEQR